MCEPQRNVDCQDTLIEIGLIVLFVILATGASLIVMPRFM
jgi:hypothetical protein